MNEIAAYGGFPSRYPHWRFGMEYEQLAKSYEYGLSKIYEMVINNNPSYAYLLEGNSLTEQKLVMGHVYGHVDFFKNNFCFRATDLDQSGPLTDPIRRPKDYDPDRRWIDKMANHGARVSPAHRAPRHQQGRGLPRSVPVPREPHRPLAPPSRPSRREGGERRARAALEVPKLRANEYMDAFINPEEYLEAQKQEARGEEGRAKDPAKPDRDILKFLARPRAPRALGARRARGHPRRGLLLRAADADEDHERGLGQLLALRLMTEKVLNASEIIDYAESNAGVMATAPGQLQPVQGRRRAVSARRERWNKGQFGREWDECTDLDAEAGLGHAPRPRSGEDLPGARAVQRRDVHRRVFDPRVLRGAEALRLRFFRAKRPLRDRERGSSRRSKRSSSPSSPTSAIRSSASSTRTTRTAASCSWSTSTRGWTCGPTTPKRPWRRWCACGSAPSPSPRSSRTRPCSCATTGKSTRRRRTRSARTSGAPRGTSPAEPYSAARYRDARGASKRSRCITLVQAVTKSHTKAASASALA
jgi:hypothetical protein